MEGTMNRSQGKDEEPSTIPGLLIAKAGELAGDGASGAIGALVGGAIGTSAAPGVGTAVGAGVGSAVGSQIGSVVKSYLRRTAIEMERRLSRKESARAMESSAWTLIEIEKLISEKCLVRDDVVDPESGRTDVVEELFEGSVRASMDAYEEKKVSFLSKMSARVIFMPLVDWPQAHYLLKVADGLTYRQMLLLELLSGDWKGHLVRFSFREREMALKAREAGTEFDQEEPRPDLLSLLLEIKSLSDAGLLERDDDTFVMDWTDVGPGSMQVSSVGAVLREMLGICEADRGDLSVVAGLLNRKGALWDKEHPPGGAGGRWGRL
jgi:hypothetical protein